MVTKSVTTCDRCGCLLDPNRPHTEMQESGGRKHDLCTRCACSFETWLKHPDMVDPNPYKVPILKDGMFTEAMYVMTQRERSNFRRASWPKNVLLGVHKGYNVKLDMKTYTSEKLTIEDYEAEDWMELPGKVDDSSDSDSTGNGGEGA